MHSNYHGLFSTDNWRIVIYTLATLYAIFLMSRKPSLFFKGSKVKVGGVLLVIGAWLYIGTRPLWCYVDTKLYTLIFRLLQKGSWSTNGNTTSEWFWNNLEYLCVKWTDASGWLTVIALGYVGGMSVAAWRWFRNHFTLAIFFLFTAFSFWAYAVNGIRNGMATSLMLMALSFITPGSRQHLIRLWPAILFAILSAATHNTMYLLVVVAMVAFFFPSKKAAFWVWGICLLLSPFSTKMFISLGGAFINDERFLGYGTAEVDASLFSRTGWRWDFIIYSAMPILLGYYVIIKRKLYDWTYVFLLSVYMYANSFWLLINEVAYSNRYAYLSWFLYPIVLLMPLVKFNLWKNQPVYVGLILICSFIFNLIF